MKSGKSVLTAVATTFLLCNGVLADELPKTCTFIKSNNGGDVKGDPPKLTLTTGFFRDKMKWGSKDLEAVKHDKTTDLWTGTFNDSLVRVTYSKGFATLKNDMNGVILSFKCSDAADNQQVTIAQIKPTQATASVRKEPTREDKNRSIVRAYRAKGGNCGAMADNLENDLDSGNLEFFNRRVSQTAQYCIF